MYSSTYSWNAEKHCLLFLRGKTRENGQRAVAPSLGGHNVKTVGYDCEKLQSGVAIDRVSCRSSKACYSACHDGLMYSQVKRRRFRDGHGARVL